MEQLGLYLNEQPLLFVLAAAIFGLAVGSFLNVVIHRVPIMMDRSWRQQCRELLELDEQDPSPQQPFNLLVPRSRCPSCGHAVGALENIPVFSYLFLRGRCRHCTHPIGIRYPLVELLSAVLSAVVAWHFGFGAAAIGALALTWALIALTFIDFDHQLLPDDITQPLLWLGLLLSFWGVFVDTQTSLIGAMAGYLSLWSVYQLFKLLTGKEGMGFGDFKLLGLLGAWMGWQMLPVIILLSSVVGALVGITLIVARGRDRNIPIPFGPYLAAAGWLALLWGHDLTEAYLHFMAIP